MKALNHARSLQEQISALALYSWCPPPGTPDIEEVTDPLRIRELLAKAAVLASHQILGMHPPATCRQMLDDTLFRDRSAWGDDVAIRTIHQSSTSDSARTAAYLKKLVGLGAQVRTAPLLPFRLIVVDQSLALVSPPDSTATGPLLLVRHPAVVRLLHRVFEYCWDGTAEFLPPGTQAATGAAKAADSACGTDPPNPERRLRLTEQQLVILRLWARGRQDAAIARELQVSPRTLRRIVSVLLRRLGVSSRFEAGMVAARHYGLLDCASDPPAAPTH